MPKIIVIIIIIIYLCNYAWSGELKHIISDGEFWYKGIFEERANCVEKEHLFIKLLEEDWNRICGYNAKFKRQTHFSAHFCIKCGLIEVSCCGNDWYRYVPNKSKQ